MNDEIKEILDILQNCKDYDDEVFLIKQHSATLLLDYITNLQKENERLRNHIQMIPYLQTVREKEDYKLRVEKASVKLSFIDEALENDTLNVPLCIAKINSALNILQNGDNNEVNK